MKRTLIILAALCLAAASSGLIKKTKSDLWLQTLPKWEPLPVVGDAGERLILTPLIQQGKIERHGPWAEVKDLTDDPKVQAIKSYSGYFTVNETYNSNLFFWFFPAMNNPEEAPLLLWLQGGPSVSSLFAVFTENGPYLIDPDNKTLSLNPYSWTTNHSVVFFNQPVGTSFSFTDSDDGYATEQGQVGQNMHTALVQFFTMFPEFNSYPFYVTGESYAGKYIPAVGYAIYKNNPNSDIKINLQGLAIGNGMTDPESMIPEYASLIYDVGHIDDSGRGVIQNYQDLCVQAIRSGKWMNAFEHWGAIVAKFVKLSGYSFIYNIYYAEDPATGGSVPDFVQREWTRKAMHVGDTMYSYVGAVYTKLEPDIMKSVRPWVEELLNSGLRIMFYNGNFDVSVGYPLSRGMFKKLQFDGADEYRPAKREMWRVGGDLAGYYKKGGTFMEVMVRNAGHMVPTDQPVWALDLITRFSRNITLSS
ncbi:venom serine carboxypeptidase-like [Ischnura elegans]|uniref:venom serine carboxypeptidase-like n=1 Tax=Ischnura elegans TaxID=197161 RepID=UPI001ED8A155|nr:venom serine carboxypeptidase-like [Ischnura elegans]